MYHYYICNEPNGKIFQMQCRAIEKYIPSIAKEKLLEDIDGSATQIYTLNGNKITVHNSNYIGAVFIESEIALEKYFN